MRDHGPRESRGAANELAPSACGERWNEGIQAVVFGERCRYKS